MKLIQYIGSKEKLFSFLYSNFTKNHKIDKKLTFFDGFSGTGIVSELLANNTKWNFITNDISLYSNILIKSIFSKIDNNRMLSILKELDEKELINEGLIFNEFSDKGTPYSVKNKELFSEQINNSRMFFREEVGKKIDTLKFYLIEYKKNNLINEEEYFFINSLILNYADRNANTTSVYGAYLKHFKSSNIKIFLEPKIVEFVKNKTNYENKLINTYNTDILSALKELQYVDIIYLDPPYNTRKYETNYHILNYIADENFNSDLIKENSKTGIPKDNNKNPFTSKIETKKYFKEIITEAMKKTNDLYISYNNEGTISAVEIEEIAVSLNCDFEEEFIEYKRFKSSDNNKGGELFELLWRISK